MRVLFCILAQHDTKHSYDEQLFFLSFFLSLSLSLLIVLSLLFFFSLSLSFSLCLPFVLSFLIFLSFSLSLLIFLSFPHHPQGVGSAGDEGGHRISPVEGGAGAAGLLGYTEGVEVANCPQEGKGGG